MRIKKNHHVACRCRDPRKTAECSGKYPDMNFVPAIAEDKAPSNSGWSAIGDE